MSETFTNKLTIKGQQKKAVAEANNTGLNITTFQVGDSNGSYYEPTENQTALKNTKYTGTFTAGTQSQIIVNSVNSNEVLYKCFIPADIGGFTIRELGLFDNDGDLILICKLPAQDKFALASGLFQPLTFTPKIIYMNPQTQAILTPTSQTVPTTSEVTNMIEESVSQSIAEIMCEAPIKNTEGHLSLNIDNSLKILDGKLTVAATLSCTDPLEIIDNKINLKINGALKIENKKLGVNFLTPNAINSGSDKILVYDNAPTLGKDLFVDFSRGDATDNYGNPVTVSGSPTFIGNKYNSNGNSGLLYPNISFGTGPWCVQKKVKFDSVAGTQILMCTNVAYGGPLLEMYGNKLSTILSSNGSSWNLVSTTYGIKADWDTTTNYYLRYRFTGTQYLIDWSIDYNSTTNQGTWTNDITINCTTAIYSSGGLKLGSYYDNSYPFSGTIDDIQVTIGSSTIIPRNASNLLTFNTSPNILLTNYKYETGTITSISDFIITSALCKSVATTANAISGGDTANAEKNYAFDGTLTGYPGYWGASQSQIGAAGMGVSFLGQKNLAGKVKKIKYWNYYATSDANVYSPSSIKVQYSLDNGTSWQDIMVVNNLNTANGASNELILPMYNFSNNHQVRLLANSSVSNYWIIQELQFFVEDPTGTIYIPETYNIYLGIDGSKEAFSTPYTIAKTLPVNPVINEVCFVTGVEPALLKKFNGNTWELYDKVPCGQVITNSSGAISAVVQPGFNQNGYNVNKNTIKKYDSGWFPVSVGYTYTKTHNLGSSNLKTTVLYSDNSDGSGFNMQVVVLFHPASYTCTAGCVVANITNTTMQIKTGSNDVAGGHPYPNTDNPAFGGDRLYYGGPKYSGYYRVLTEAV